MEKPPREEWAIAEMEQENGKKKKERRREKKIA
jgi:hypothetical protein